MIGPFLLLLSWLLLRIEKKGLSELGFNMPVLQARQLSAGFGLTALAASIQQLGYAQAEGTEWIINPAFGYALLGESLRFNINSVLYEELVFRGYLLYQAIRWLGVRRAVLLDAAAFGVYHWFTFGAFGNPVAMAFIFVSTGLFGLMFALAFSQTRSLALPIGLHLGWNIATNLIFSAGPMGPALLIAANGARRLQAHGGSGALFKFLLPAVVAGGVCWFLARRRVPAKLPD